MAGYSKTPLQQKLGIKEGHLIAILEAPRGYKTTLDRLPDRVKWSTKISPNLDFVQVFVRSSEDLIGKLPLLKKHIKFSGMIWVSWPKKASGVPTDVTEDVVRSTALKSGLVDVKVCAVDHVWSGLKLVIPVKDR